MSPPLTAPLVSEKTVTYRSGDRTRLEGTLRRVQSQRGAVVLAHGLTTDRDEYGGFYARLADALADAGIASLRFDFRAHGASGGEPAELTLTGGTLDLRASIDRLVEAVAPGALGVVGTSFGVPPACLTAGAHPGRIDTMVLLSPLLSFEATYLDPPDGFAPLLTTDAKRELEERGALTRPDGFEFGATLVEEFHLLEPFRFLRRAETPVLTVQGAADEAVPPSASRTHGAPTPDSEYVEIPGVGHGFLPPDESSLGAQPRVIDRTVEWFEGRLDD